MDSDQAFRSDMNWEDINQNQLHHFQKLGKIRQANPVIGTGHQLTIDVHTCARYNETDTIIIRVLPIAGKTISVNNFFEDGITLTELYTGQTAKIVNGKISFPKDENKIAILKKQK